MFKQKLKLFFQEYRWLILMSVIFLIAYNFLNFATTYHFNSPDEAQYFYTAKSYAETWQMNYSEPLNDIAGGLVRLRGMDFDSDRILPAIVVGFPMIYGLFGKLFGSNAIIFFTPILAVIGVWFFYLLIKHVFDDRKLALISSFLLFIQPAWWYYSSRAMFNNIAFLVFLISGIYFLLKALDRNNANLYILAGMGIGLALITRLSEMVWVGTALIIILVANRKKINWTGFSFALASLVLIFLPVLNLNKQIYGNAFSFGYNPLSVSSGAQLQQSVSWMSYIYHLVKLALIPFGLSFKNIWLNLKEFIIYFFWPMNLAFLIGVFFVMKGWKQIKNKQKVLIIISVIISGLLVLSYGSWYFSDSVGGDRVAIGSSYFRYFLPIYMLLIPWISFGLLKIGRKSRFIMIAILIMLSLFSVKTTFWGKDDGLIRVRNGLQQNQRILERIDEITPENSIFITGSLDKALYPEKKVIYALQKDSDFEAIKKLIKNNQSIYKLVLSHDIDKWIDDSGERLADFDLKYKKHKKIVDNFWLVEIN